MNQLENVKINYISTIPAGKLKVPAIERLTTRAYLQVFESLDSKRKKLIVKYQLLIIGGILS